MLNPLSGSGLHIRPTDVTAIIAQSYKYHFMCTYCTIYTDTQRAWGLLCTGPILRDAEQLPILLKAMGAEGAQGVLSPGPVIAMERRVRGVVCASVLPSLLTGA